VDLDGGEIQVFHTLQRIDGKLVRTPTKSDAGQRIVPLDSFCVAALEQHRKRQELQRAFAGQDWQETGYVFTSSVGTPLIDRNVLREYYKLLKAAKLPRRRFHDLRHACVSLLAAQGVPEKTIAEIVGHSDVRLTKNVYQHAQKEHKRAAIAKGLGNLLGKADGSLVAPSKRQKPI
jgi:integrase